MGLWTIPGTPKRPHNKNYYTKPSTMHHSLMRLLSWLTTSMSEYPFLAARSAYSLSGAFLQLLIWLLGMMRRRSSMKSRITPRGCPRAVISTLGG